jgi:hypothetical protein
MVGNPDYGHAHSSKVVFFSLSHRRSDVSYCEIDSMRRTGPLLRTAMASADLRYIDSAECAISRCETAAGLCDRLSYASSPLGMNYRFCRRQGG